MQSFEQVLATCAIDEPELAALIEQRLVLPLKDEGIWYFTSADVARVELICELRRDLAVNEEALPLILDLLDRLYGLRAAIRRIGDALDQLPEEDRRILEDALADGRR